MSAVVSSSAGECGSNVDNSSSCRLRTIAGTVISVRTPSTSSNNSNNNNNNNIGPSRLRDRRDSTLSATNRIGTTTNTATALANNSSTPNTNSTKQCCFHWCCCCRCSCLAVKAVEEAKSESARPEVMKLFDDDKLPTLEEVQLWGESFDRLMKSEGGRKVFREFLRGEYSEENILFWLACEELKKETNPSVVEERARFIYEDYISILSPKEVSLDSRVRELVNRNMVEPKADMFEEAQTQIYTLMHRDSYPRFVNSQVYKDLLQSVSNATPSTSTSKPSNNARKKNAS